MAVSDEQYVRAKHVKAATNKIRTELAAIEPDISVATTTSDGTVKILSDEDLDAYLNAVAAGADTNSIELVPGTDLDINEFKITGSCHNGVVTLTGNTTHPSISFGSNVSQRTDVWFTIPEGYRPTSQKTGTGYVVYRNGSARGTASITIGTDGVVEVSTSAYRQNTTSIGIEGSISYTVPVQEPPTLDGTYVVSVSQVKQYISQISSGGGSGTGPGEYVLWEGNSSDTTLEIDGNINDYDRVEVYFTWYQSQDFVGFNEAPYEVAINDIYIDGGEDTGPFYLEVFSDGSFRYYNPEFPFAVTITKVVGIIN